MNPREKYDQLRQNFKQKTPVIFHFLCQELGFETAVYSNVQQDDGVVTSDQFQYHKPPLFKVVLSNDYHPLDYGFEITLVDLKTGQEELLFSILQEDQDLEQSYLLKAAEFLKKGCGARLNSQS